MNLQELAVSNYRSTSPPHAIPHNEFPAYARNLPLYTYLSHVTVDTTTLRAQSNHSYGSLCSVLDDAASITRLCPFLRAKSASATTPSSIRSAETVVPFANVRYDVSCKIARAYSPIAGSSGHEA